MENKQEKKQEESRPKYIEGIEVLIEKVNVIPDYEQREEVKKVIFHCVKSKGNGEQFKITWKPKVKTIDERRGLNIERPSNMFIDDLPEKIFEIGELCNEHGATTVLVDFMHWDTKKDDGTLMTVRFINSAKIFDKWKIIRDQVKKGDTHVDIVV